MATILRFKVILQNHCLSVNHKVKIVNFPGGTSKKIQEKLDDMIKEQPDDIIVHVGTKDLTNNVKLLNKKRNSAFAKNLLHHINRTE